jgi:type IV fimbrial biogenesis protein FimT
MRTEIKRQRGFTMVEVMIVVFIIGILTAIVVPGMGKMIRNQRVKTAAFDVFASLTFARSEALKRNSNVTITPASATDWTKGWTITDANGNVLKEEADRKLTANEMVMTGPATVVFARNGRLGSATAPKFNISTSGTNMQVRCVSVDLSGRPLSTEAVCP